MNIYDLILNGQHKLAEQDAIALKEHEDEKRAVEEGRQALIAQFNADALKYTPDGLKPFIVTERDPDYRPGYDEWVHFNVPQCADIAFVMDRFHDGEGKFSWRPVGNKSIIFNVWIPRLVMGDGEWGIEGDVVQTSDYEIALALASRAFAYRQELEADAKQKNLALAESLHERDAAKLKEIKAKRELDKRQAIVAMLNGDPVMLALVLVMQKVVAERETFQDLLDMVDMANEHAEQVEDGHARSIERAHELVRNAEQNMRYVRDKEADARDEAERAERKLKLALMETP